MGCVYYDGGYCTLYTQELCKYLSWGCKDYAEDDKHSTKEECKYCDECGELLEDWEEELCGHCYNIYKKDTRPNHPDDPVQ